MLTRASVQGCSCQSGHVASALATNKEAPEAKPILPFLATTGILGGLSGAMAALLWDKSVTTWAVGGLVVGVALPFAALKLAPASSDA